MTLFDQNNTTAVAVQRTRMLADLLRSYVGLVPTWRAEYFDRGSGQKARSVLIVAENVLVALEEVRARMALTCARAKVTKLNLDLATIIVLPASCPAGALDIQEGRYGLGSRSSSQAQEAEGAKGRSEPSRTATNGSIATR
jgi:hypothetical protein